MGGRPAAVLLTLAVVASACAAQPPDEPEIGGTLRLGLVSSIDLDPARTSSPAAIELFRCCLLRTLLTYPGRPADQGGIELRSDLASGPPEVSADGLRWTFHLEPGLTYAPPFEGTPITAGDFVRALERVAALGPAAPVGPTFDVVRGFAEAREGGARTIEGLSTPDELTLVVDLEAPTGDLAHRLALPAAAPIPPGAGPGLPFVASGPYMLAGSRDVDPAGGVPPSGYRPGRLISLVRNPSWSRRGDEIRPAYADRIEVLMGRSRFELARLVDAGEVQLQLDGVPPGPQIRKYRLDPQLEDQLHAPLGNTVRFLSMSPTIPPFDDVYVRRAVALAIDKQALRDLAGGPGAGNIARHVIPASLLAGRLQGYDPLGTNEQRGDREEARAEMRRSSHDDDGDGRCDADACRSISILVPDLPPFPAQAASISRDLAAIGLDLAPSLLDPAIFPDPSQSPAALTLALPARPTFPDPAALLPAVFASPELEPTVQGCLALRGEARPDCWADLDRLLMEEVLPLVPYLIERNVDVVADDVVNHTLDQSTGLASVARMALAGGREDD
ncbi:MAG TPA: ABC transporter substrate-binding protein [Actinomycetota bacterium]